MSPNVEDFPTCSKCGGTLFPLVICKSCGAESVLRDARRLDWVAACAKCGTFGPWQVICDECRSQFPAPGLLAKPPTKPARLEATAEEGSGPPGRPKRRIKGEVDTTALLDLLKVLGLDPSRSQAVVDHGYDALWKLARASPEDLARIPEVGPVAARKMLASFHLIKYSPPQRTKGQIHEEEYACPLCGCLTSAFAASCLECGAAFDEEEMDESIRAEFARESDAASLAFYSGRLVQRPNDSDLLYAQALLLNAMGRNDEAIEALDRAAATAPDARKIKVAQLRIQAKELQKPSVAEKLRSTASALMEEVAWEQEVAQLDHLITGAGPGCPNCGASVPRDAGVCPSCGERLPGASPRVPSPSATPGAAVTVAAPELDTIVDDLLVGELEQSLTPEELELTKSAVLDWLIEELETTMGPEARPLSAPEKMGGASQSALSTSVGFLSGWMRGSRGLVSGLRPKPGPRGTGRVNGIVNGQGRVNGLVNGVGRTNGLVNGVGRVNGVVAPTGRVNGLVASEGRVNGVGSGARFVREGGRAARLSSPSTRVRYAAIAAGILIAIVIATLLVIPAPSEPIVIDGSFGDWAPVPKFDTVTATADSNVALARYASLFDAAHDSLYLYASTRGPMFGDPLGYDGVDFLVDADGNASTGYRFNGIGADAVVEIYGGNNAVAGARFYGFPPNSDLNWSQRQLLGSVPAAASGYEVEAKVSTYLISGFSPSAFRISVYADDFRGSSSRSEAPLSSRGGAVLLELLPLTTVVGSGSTALFAIRVHGLAVPTSGWSVSSFVFNATPGVTVSLSAESVTLTQGQPVATTTASVSAPGFFPGDVVQVDVTGATVSASMPLVVRGGPVRAYVLAPPSVVRVDGLFADWVGRDRPDSDATPINNSDVDIVRYGAAVNSTSAYFHVAVAGDLMAGRVPDQVLRYSPGGNGSGGPLPRQTGEDILRAYIDLNASDSVGLSIDGIYADFMLEVRGVAGRITTSTLFRWTGFWLAVSSPTVALAKNETDIEGSVAVAPITNTTRMVFESTDWSGAPDMTPPDPAPTFSPMHASSIGPATFSAPSLIIMSGTNYTMITATKLVSTPTVDGNCGSSAGEYAGAVSASNANIRFFAGLNASYLFVCVEVPADQTNNSAGDWGELLFDPNFDGTSQPNPDDRLFRVESRGNFTQEKGDGTAWVACASSCDTGNAATGRFNNTSNETYEFQIGLADVWGSNATVPDAIAGFAILVHDQTGPQTYTWGADNVAELNPSTWGRIQIPEFSDVLLVSVSVLVLIGWQIRRRRS